MSTSNRSTIAIIGSIVGIIVLLFVARSYTRHATVLENTKTTRTNREIAMSCTTDMATKFHIHSLLAIVINGQKQDIPTNVGIDAEGCMHPLHTHDAMGKIHIESPETRDFTLGDLFAVWGKPFDATHIMDAVADGTHSIRVQVNGTNVDTYENTVFHDGDQIGISYEEKNNTDSDRR